MPEKKGKNIWDPKYRSARARNRALGEGLFHVTHTIPGTIVTLSSTGLFAENALEGAINLDASKIIPACMYYAVALASTGFLYAFTKEHESKKS